MERKFGIGQNVYEVRNSSVNGPTLNECVIDEIRETESDAEHTIEYKIHGWWASYSEPLYADRDEAVKALAALFVEEISATKAKLLLLEQKQEACQKLYGL